MASQPNTWNVLQTIQSVIQNQVTVAATIDGGTNTSPFSLFNAADQATYGTTNAIYIASPKDVRTLNYKASCWIIPPQPDQPSRYTEGGKMRQHQHIRIICYFAAMSNYYRAIQFCTQAADALAPVLLKHAASGWGPTVIASSIAKQGNAGYHTDELVQQPFFCWGQVLEVVQEYTVTMVE